MDEMQPQILPAVKYIVRSPSPGLPDRRSVLDPILYDLFDPSIRRVPSTNVNGKQLQGYSYERPFDQTYVNHLLETLLSVIKFGGQGFGKTARTSLVRRCQHSGLVERIQSGKRCRVSLTKLMAVSLQLA